MFVSEFSIIIRAIRRKSDSRVGYLLLVLGPLKIGMKIKRSLVFVPKRHFFAHYLLLMQYHYLVGRVHSNNHYKHPQAQTLDTVVPEYGYAPKFSLPGRIYQRKAGTFMVYE